MTSTATPKISIIVPVYNAEKYLEECIFSLIHQSYYNIEIICINDGSKDNSLKILQNFQNIDSRIIVLSQSNSGPAMARNYGLAIANGDFLMFCDADDTYEPNMCEEMLSTIENSDYDFVMCDCSIVEIDKNTRPVGAAEYNRLNFSGEINLTNKTKEKINTLLWNKIFRMDYVRTYDMHFPNGFEMDDDAFVYQYVSVSKKIYGLTKKLYNYKVISGSIMANFFSDAKKKKTYDIIESYSFTIAQIKKNGKLNDNEVFLLSRINNKLKWVMNLTDKDHIIDFMKKTNEKLLNYFTIQNINIFPILALIHKNKYNDAYHLYKGIKIKKIFGIIKIKKSNNCKEVYVMGIKIHKKIITEDRKKYYLFGIKYREKKLISPKINDNNLQGYIHYKTNSLADSVCRAITTAFLHQKTFGGYKNKHEGATVFLVGAGPTVNNFNGKHGAIYVGLNRAFLRSDINFNYIFSCDKIGIEKFIKEMIEYSKRCTMFIGDINCGKNFQISESTFNKLKAYKYKCDFGIRNFKFTVDIETEPLGAFHSVAFQAMQFILYTNPSKIYLVGIDCGNAGKHFAGEEHDVASRGEKLNDTLHLQIEEWKQLKEFANHYYPETEIISVNPVGLKGIFKDVYTESYLSEHHEIDKKCIIL